MLDTDEDESSSAAVTLAGGSKRTAAMFLLTLKEKYHLTQLSVNFTVDQVADMFPFIAADIRSYVTCYEKRDHLGFFINIEI